MKYVFYEKFKERRDQMKEGGKEETRENILKFWTLEWFPVASHFFHCCVFKI